VLPDLVVRKMFRGRGEMLGILTCRETPRETSFMIMFSVAL
jgi:hypothetical protein